MSNCCICNSALTSSGEVVLKLSLNDKKYVQSLSKATPPEEYVYCKPCNKILNDKNLGAQLIKGTLESSLRIAGVNNAEHIAKKFHAFLMKKAAEKPVS